MIVFAQFWLGMCSHDGEVVCLNLPLSNDGHCLELGEWKEGDKFQLASLHFLRLSVEEGRNGNKQL